MPPEPHPRDHAVDITVENARSWDALVAGIAEFLSIKPPDPFAAQTVLVPSVGHGRVLAQQIASMRPREQAISAGVDFVTPAALHRRATANEQRWSTTSLAQVVAAALADVGHQFAPQQLVGESLRVTSLFRRYLRHCPNMLADWVSEKDVDSAHTPLPNQQRWQADVWRRVVHALGLPADATAAAAVLPADFPVAVVLTGSVPTATRNLISEIAASRPVRVWAYQPMIYAQDQATLSPNDPATPNNQDVALTRYLPSPLSLSLPMSHVNSPHLDPSSNTQNSPLSAAKARLSGFDQLPAHADGSLEVHLAHGPSRQMEVLREVLCGVLADDPALEPRDILVLASDLRTYAPLAQTIFYPTGNHPGHQLRLGVANNYLPHSNPLIELLGSVLCLPAQRCEVRQLVDIAAVPQVAARFGFDEAALARLRELTVASGMIWGLDAAHRQRFGLADVRQSTWFTGVERLGVSALQSPDASLTPPTALPVTGVEPQDLELIGSLSELVSRLRRAIAHNSTPATFDTWRERLLEQLDWLAAPTGPEDTTLVVARNLLATLRGDDSTPLIDAADLAGLLGRLATSRNGRPSYCNGSLLLTQLGDLTAVSHDVVVLLGVDDDQWPRRTPVDPDDLIPEEVRSTERAEQRWQLLAGLLAARKRFIVITKGLDPVTNHPLAEPLALRDLRRLISACGADSAQVVRRHPLQPHEWSDFIAEGDSEPFSFDADALRGALAATQPAATPPPPQWPLPLPFPDGHRLDGIDRVQLGDLESFFSNPAGELLAAHGLRLSRWDAEPPRDLPLSLGPLERYQIGQQLLDEAVSGVAQEVSLRRVRLAGMVAPGNLGSEQLTSLIQDVERIANQVTAHRKASARVAVNVTIDERRLSGSLMLWNDKLLSWRFGRPKAAHIAALWLRLLALATVCPDTPAVGGVIGRGSAIYLRAPNPSTARQLLAEAIRLYASGLTQLVPLPIETSAAWAGFNSARRTDPRVDAERAWLGNQYTGIPGEVKQPDRPEWRYFFPTQRFDDLLVPSVMPDDPGFTNEPHQRDAGTSRFDQLSRWFWAPITAARISAAEFGSPTTTRTNPDSGLRKPSNARNSGGAT